MSTREVANDWYSRVCFVADCHYKAALHYSQLSFWFGFPTVILATIVGTSVFATFQSKPDFWWQITVGAMSIVTAILSALQSFLGYSDKAEKHRNAGSKYNSVGRELELWKAMPEGNYEKLENIRAKIDNLSSESPHIPQFVFNKLENAKA